MRLGVKNFEAFSNFKHFYDSTAIVSNICQHIISEKCDVPLSVTVIITGIFPREGRSSKGKFILRKIISSIISLLLTSLQTLRIIFLGSKQ